jgi:hypothetical protein
MVILRPIPPNQPTTWECSLTGSRDRRHCGPRRRHRPPSLAREKAEARVVSGRAGGHIGINGGSVLRRRCPGRVVTIMALLSVADQHKAVGQAVISAHRNPASPPGDRSGDDVGRGLADAQASEPPAQPQLGSPGPGDHRSLGRTAGTAGSVSSQGARRVPPAGSDRDGRRCVRFGCLEVADWMVHDLQGGEPPPARLTWTWSQRRSTAGPHRGGVVTLR